MSALRVRVHTDERGGRAWYLDASNTDRDRPWLLFRGGTLETRYRLSDAETTGDGWSEAAVTVLPEVKVVRVVCGCGVAPDGAPGASGCSAECGAPEEVQAHHPSGYHATGYVQDNEISANGAWYSPDGAERQATAMLAVAYALRAQGGEQA